MNINSKLKVVERKLSENSEKFDKFDSKFSEIEKCIVQLNSHQSSIVTPTPTNKKRLWSEMVKDSVSNTKSSNGVIPNTPKRFKISEFKTPLRTDHVLIIKIKPPVKRTDSESNANGEVIEVDADDEMQADDQVEKESVDDVVKRHLDPVTDPVKKLRQTAQGHVVLHCNDKEAVSTVKSKLTNAVGKDYSIDEPKIFNPLIKIHGFESKYLDEQQLIDALRAQNPHIFSAKSVVTVIESKKYREKDSC